MVQLAILTGKQRGTWVPRRFPVRIGRSSSCDLQLYEHGVWDQHCRIELDPAAGFILQTEPDALVTANGQPVQRAILRNGDTIDLGAVRVQFWLGPAVPGRLRVAEWLSWILIGAICFLQVALAYWLPH